METLRLALESLRAHKLRSALTLLGVIIGVMTVIVVVSISAGLNRFVGESLLSLSPDVFVVTRMGIITSRDEFLEARRRKPIEQADVEAIERQCRGCGEIGVAVQANMPVTRGRERLGRVEIHGATANMADLSSLELAAGRFYSDREVEHAAAVAVIGWNVREEIFGRLDPIGRKLRIAGSPYEVIGVIEKQGSLMGNDQDTRAYLPLRSFQRQFGARNTLDIAIRPVAGMAAMNEVQDEVRTIMRARRHARFRDPDPFAIVTADAVQQVWNAISAGAFALMFFISGISLVVGGIVIANIMLVSVVERTREIGIRRATGAKRRDILLQFLTEATLLGLLGGLIGVGLGAGVSRVVAAVSPMPTLVEPGLVVIALSVALVTGGLAGFFPARKAARLEPVEALRFE